MYRFISFPVKPPARFRTTFRPFSQHFVSRKCGLPHHLTSVAYVGCPALTGRAATGRTGSIRMEVRVHHSIHLKRTCVRHSETSVILLEQRVSLRREYHSDFRLLCRELRKSKLNKVLLNVKARCTPKHSRNTAPECEEGFKINGYFYLD